MDGASEKAGKLQTRRLVPGREAYGTQRRPSASPIGRWLGRAVAGLPPNLRSLITSAAQSVFASAEESVSSPPAGRCSGDGEIENATGDRHGRDDVLLPSRARSGARRRSRPHVLPEFEACPRATWSEHGSLRDCAVVPRPYGITSVDCATFQASTAKGLSRCPFADERGQA
jgi:hypothetical protein